MGKCKREGTHFAAVEPKGTTKKCSRCGVATSKPFWVREHSCSRCGYTADRDANAAENVLQRGLSAIGMGYAESTLSETATATGTDVSPVPASRIIEQRSPPSSARHGAWARGRVGRKSPVANLTSSTTRQSQKKPNSNPSSKLASKLVRCPVN
ncbi:zinc ribbon domain-containing protein [Halococcus sp. AFM35]|uniref:zinc ribbon domain-containing protein n=1 Tax=Halococcus sp. AFM35 TaxID=3421653 RepID=UPI003EC1089D